MPIEKTTVNGKTAYRWGRSGKAYVGAGGRAKAEAQARAAYANGYEGFDDAPDPKELAPLLADLLYGLYGAKALSLLEGANDAGEHFAEWRSVDHPRGKDGRFIPRGSAEAVSTAKAEVGKVLKGDRSAATGEKLLQHLSILTVKQLGELHREHGQKAPGRLRQQLVDGILARLEAGKKGKGKPAAKKAPARATPKPAAKDPKAERARILSGERKLKAPAAKKPAGRPAPPAKAPAEKPAPSTPAPAPARPAAKPPEAPKPAGGITPENAAAAAKALAHNSLLGSRHYGQGMTDLADLKHHLQQAVPGLTQDDFAGLMKELSARRLVELHGINERHALNDREREAAVATSPGHEKHLAYFKTPFGDREAALRDAIEDYARKRTTPPAPALPPRELARLVSDAGRKLPSQFGHAHDPSDPGRRDHKVLVADLYRAVKDKLPAGTGLDDFKRQLLKAHQSGDLELGRTDLVQFLPRAGAELPESEIRHPSGAGEFHHVNVTAGAARHAGFAEGGLRGVQIFAAGTHRGKEYTTADLDDMVANFNAHSSGERPLLRVPAVLGHEESQDLLNDSSLPAAAWASRLHRDGPFLLADFDDVPPQVMRLLRGRRYRTVSAEVYDDPPEGVPGKGRMLRRVAFLGGDIPQIKSLADIPVPEEHAEGGAAYRPAVLTFREWAPGAAGAFWLFSEVKHMDREAMLKHLQDSGVDASAIPEAVPDETLAEWCRSLEDRDPDQYDDDQDVPAPADDAEKAEYAERLKRFHGMARKYAAHFGHKMSDLPALDGQTQPDGGTPTADDHHDRGRPFSERQVRRLIDGAVKRAVEGIVKPAVGELTRFTEEQARSEKRRTVEKFCEDMVKAGRMTPAQADPDNPLGDHADLLRRDNKAVVTKFKEGGKLVELTDFQVACRRIEDRRPFKFGEKVGGGKGPKPGEVDVEPAVTFFRERQDAYEKVGTTEAEFLETYKKATPEQREDLLRA